MSVDKCKKGWVEMKKISNPLTVVGIFAGIAEVAGTVVLPLVPLELQFIFIWYVMGFPILLVTIFFTILCLKPKVLYAPSDFANEDNFMQLIYAAKIDKKLEVVKAQNPSIAPELESIQSSLLNNIAPKNVDRYNKMVKMIRLMATANNGVTAPELARKLGTTVTRIDMILQELMENGVVTYKNVAGQDGEVSKVKRYIVLDKEDLQNG